MACRHWSSVAAPVARRAAIAVFSQLNWPLCWAGNLNLYNLLTIAKTRIMLHHNGISLSRFYCIICLFLSIHIRRRMFRITLSFHCITITIMYIPVRDGQEHWHLPHLVGRQGLLVTTRWLSVSQSIVGLLLTAWSSCATLCDALSTRPLYLYNFYTFCWYQCMCQSAITHLTCTVCHCAVITLRNQRITIIWVLVISLPTAKLPPVVIHKISTRHVFGGRRDLKKNIIVRLSSFTKTLVIVIIGYYAVPQL